jgi:primosomal protein N'
MTFDAQQYIPLAGAYLCQDCDSVGNSAMQCPACASEVLMSLAVVFDRKETVVEAELLQFPAMAA